MRLLLFFDILKVHFKICNFSAGTIVVRVTNKSGKKERSCGSIFEFYGFDGTGEIQFVSFNATTVMFFDLIKVIKFPILIPLK